MRSHRKCRDDFFLYSLCAHFKDFMIKRPLGSRKYLALAGLGFSAKCIQFIVILVGNNREKKTACHLQCNEWFIDMARILKAMLVSIEIVSVSMHSREHFHYYYYCHYHSSLCFYVVLSWIDIHISRKMCWEKMLRIALPFFISTY